uniref:hypothetical protein n=1 Tax=Altererythrobacter segetis TaxID=1104773 RepID=UPI001408E4AC|nr:hypothetical protein [Altererythrobacter segetis]
MALVFARARVCNLDCHPFDQSLGAQAISGHILPMNAVERETVILRSAWDMIDDMVNWAMFCKSDRAELVNLLFETSYHARLFVILLGDFLSQVGSFNRQPIPLNLLPVPGDARPSDKTFLFHLRGVCANPQLGNDTAALSDAVERFAEWLEGEFVTVGVNLHSIDVIADITVQRMQYLKMCGDIAKHSLGRLEGNAKRLRDLLEAAGRPIDEASSYLALGVFFEWFFDDIFIYHSSQIAEFLNNIRWAIYDYLGPEFARSYHVDERATPTFPLYGFHVPETIKEPLAVAMYWDVMNQSLHRPYFQRFTIPDWAKQRY